MSPSTPAAADTPRRVLAVAGSVLIVVLCFVSGSVALAVRVTADDSWVVTKAGTLTPAGIALLLVALVMATLTVWRHRWPVQLCLAACVVAVVLPLDALPALFFLYAVLVSATSTRWRWTCVVCTTLAVLFSIYSDAYGRTQRTSFWRGLLGVYDDARFPWWLALVITTVILLCFVGAALIVDAWRGTRTAQEQVVEARTRVGELSQEVYRQRERERIAREIHDALGHRLSLLNLHASALQLKAGDDEDLLRSARIVQESAQKSVSDLRSLLDVLRQPDSPDVSRAVPTLDDLPALLAECRAAGVEVSSSVYVDPSADLDPRLSRSTYRIAQELLTNARKHAPGRPIRLTVDISPTSGIEVTAANPLAANATDEFVPGNGLIGIQERAGNAGGQARIWIDEDRTFRSVVHLPWQQPTSVAVEEEVR